MSVSAAENSISPQDKRQWFVRMSNGSIFGPVHTRGLLIWTQEGRVMPDDEVSEDRESWLAAHKLPELDMDTFIEMSDGTFSGPYHADSIQPLIAEGKVPADAKTVHRDEMAAGRKAEEVKKAPESEVKKSEETEEKKVQAESEDGDISAGVQSEELQKEMSELKTVLEELQRNNKTLQSGNKTLEAKNKSLKQEMKKLKTEHEDLIGRQEKLSGILEARQGEVESLTHKLDHSAKELQQSHSDYQELLLFANTRDTEYATKLKALEAEQESLQVSPESVAARRISSLETRLGDALKELEELRNQLAASRAEVALKERPLEVEIARIQDFGESAIEVVQQILVQEREMNEQARAASVARQESLYSQLEQLRRAMRLAPGELTRGEEIERRNDRLIAKLRQDLESAQRQHQLETHRSAEKIRELEQRANAIERREASVRDQLAHEELRTAEFESVKLQLQKREVALQAAEREFEDARRQWQSIETTLMQRIEELEAAASQPEEEDESASTSAKAYAFEARPWMRLQR